MQAYIVAGQLGLVSDISIATASSIQPIHKLLLYYNIIIILYTTKNIINFLI